MAFAGATLALCAWWTIRKGNLPRPDPGLLSLFLLGLASRCLLGLWGPLHINGQGPVWVSAAFSQPDALHAYGPGYAELFHAATLLAPTAPDTALFAFNAVLGALIPPAVFILVRLSGLDRMRSFVATAFFAIEPVAVRTGATEGYFTVITLLALGVSLSFMAALKCLCDRRWWPAVLFALSGLLFTAQVVRVHPAAWIVTALALLTAASYPWPSTPGRRLLTLLALAATCGLVTALAGGAAMAGTIQAIFEPGSRTIYSLGQVALIPSAPAILVGLALLATLPWTRPRAPVVLAVVALLAWDATCSIYGQNPLWQACYGRMFWPFMAAGLTAVAVRSRIGRPIALTLATAAATALFLMLFTPLTSPSTEVLEYRFLREQFAQIPGHCRIVVPQQVRTGVPGVPHYVALDTPRLQEPTPTVATGAELEARTHDSACLYYVHIAGCSTPMGLPVCQRIERYPMLKREASISLPARHTSNVPYLTDPVPVVLYRVLRNN